jgi:nitrite reductase/ring-hydroxylating ferredoxin subunit
MSCATGPRASNEHELNLARSSSAPSQTPAPPSLEELQGGAVKPPVVLRSGAETADYAYATGCYHAYERICGKLLTDAQSGACRDEGLAVCEKYGHEFGDWIRSGSGSARK